ncbi:hypothetical protein WA158_000579 [Blastocystis sp. Blastoise]
MNANKRINSIDDILAIVDKQNLPNKELLKQQLIDLHQFKWVTKDIIESDHSYSLYGSLPSYVNSTLINTPLILQIFFTYPAEPPRLYIYIKGEYGPNHERSYIYYDGEYRHIVHPYLKNWNNTHTLRELAEQLYNLFQEEPPMKKLIDIIDCNQVHLKKKIGEGYDGVVYKVEYMGKIYALKLIDKYVLEDETTNDARHQQLSRANSIARAHQRTQIDTPRSRTDENNLSGSPVVNQNQNSHGNNTRPSTTSIAEKNAKRLKRIQREISIHVYLNNPNIVQLYGLCDYEGKYMGILMERCKHTLLYILLNKKYILNTAIVRSYIYNIVDAIIYIHSKNILHRDIKAANVLIDDNNHAKLCDFGFARSYTTDSPLSQVGTFSHVAPEILSGHYNNKVDVYSFGVLLIEIFTRQDINIYRHLNPSDESMIHELKITISPAIVGIIHLCLQSNPQKRPSMKQVKSYLDTIDWSNINYQ